MTHYTMRYVVKEITPSASLPAYKWAVLDTKRIRYAKYCTSAESAERVAAELNNPKPRKRKGYFK